MFSSASVKQVAVQMQVSNNVSLIFLTSVTHFYTSCMHNMNRHSYLLLVPCTVGWENFTKRD